MQLSFKGMLDEVDRELKERANNIKLTMVEDCDETCLQSKMDKTASEIKQMTNIVDFLIEYFKKYSPDSVWGQWLQNYYHVKVTIQS